MISSTPRLSAALATVGFEANEWLDLAGELAQLPIDRVWVWDAVMGRGDGRERPVLEALTLAAAALSRYSTLSIGTLVLDVTKRHPAVAAKSIATIASLAPGHLAIGLGAGGGRAEHVALGIPYGETNERLTLLEETLGIFRAMLEGDPAARITRRGVGGAPSLTEAASSPRPNPKVPLYVASDHARGIRLAATAADGWIAPVATFANGVSRFRSEAERAGREGLTTIVVQELGKGEEIAQTPFGADPDAWLKEQRTAGADLAVVTLRTREDVAALSVMMR